MIKNWVCIDNRGYEKHLVVGKVYTEIITGFIDHQCILIKDERKNPRLFKYSAASLQDRASIVSLKSNHFNASFLG